MLRSDIRGAPMRAPTSDRQPDLDHGRKVRELLTALAEIDRAYEVDLDTVRASDAPVTIKQTVLGTMRKRHQEHRASYVQALSELQPARKERR